MEGKSYTLTGIDPETWRKFKTACVYNDISIRDSFINHMLDVVIGFNLIDKGISDIPGDDEKGDRGV